MQAQAGIQRSGDAEAGPEGWTEEAGGASRTRTRSSRRADRKGASPEDREPGGSRPEELTETRGAGRKAGAGRIGTSLGTDAGGLESKAQAGETTPKAGRRRETRAARSGPGVRGSSWMALPEG